MEKRKLNLGCGDDIREGYINVDSAALPGVDIVHNITKLPLPFKDGECEEVVCQDVLEHIDYIPLLKDIHRILEKGGRLIVRVPHYTSRNNAVDPTHCRRFSIDTLDFFVNDPDFPDAGLRSYYMDFHFAKVESIRLTFAHTSPLLYLNHFVKYWVNKSRHNARLYELSGLSGLFPAENIEAILIK